MNDILISVIVPMYNEEKNIINLLNNFKKQTFKNFELVLVNDGSVDTTDLLVKNYDAEGLNITYFTNNNNGVGYSRNYGISKARGEYVTFLDSDDYFDKQFLEKMFYEVTKTDSNICYCGYNVVYPNKIQSAKSRFSNSDVFENFLLGVTKIHTSCWLIKKEIIIKNNIIFLEDTNWGEDFYFFCKLLFLERNISFVPEYLSYYRHEFEVNRLSKNSTDKLDLDVDLIKRVIDDLELPQTSRPYQILVNYRLPMMIITRLIGLSKIITSKEEFLKISSAYSNLYCNKKYIFGFQSLKQFIKLCQLKCIQVRFNK
ncbi:glycosyltransferase family 2 protein [Vagococcus fluvialis]|uniref:glycosyltransferase family 2 protein n=1 Tax=Vagococcus fluvialis TaxID=2738 RepID=UPI00288FA50E|nr:glycosyltransferase family 2 protein [Vagococcus fluvialis]MDT2747771.1 glycosyltransferase family 2 protein [Vagococcus fluvialis]